MIILCILFIIVFLIIGFKFIDKKVNKDYINKSINEINKTDIKDEQPIKIKEIGILETSIGLPTTDKLYGDTIYICPKCKCHHIRTTGYISNWFVCSNCGYSVELKYD